VDGLADTPGLPEIASSRLGQISHPRRLASDQNLIVAILLVVIAAAIVIVVSATIHRWALPLGVVALAALWTIGYINFGHTADETGTAGVAILSVALIWAPTALVSAAGVGLGKWLAGRRRQ